MEGDIKEPEIEPLGQEEPGQRLSGMGKLASFTPLLFPLILAVVVSWAMVSFMAAPKGAYRNDITRLETDLVVMRETTQATNDNIQEVNTTLTDHVNTLVDKINTFEQPEVQDLSEYAKLNDLQVYTTQEYLSSLLDAKFIRYDETLADMEDILEDLQLINEDKEIIMPDNETRWEIDIYGTNLPETYASIDRSAIHISPRRIEEADDYIITVPILNYRDENGTGYVREITIQIRLTPKTGDRVKVDEDEIYLDSAYYPFTLWTTDVIERSDGTCRRLIFTSDKIILPAPLSDPEKQNIPEVTVIRLDFTLAYK